LNNLFAGLNPPAQGERFDTLLAHRNLVIERIVSSADIEPVDYVQEQDEWVLLLRGGAVMQVAGETVTLGEGDYRFLPAGTLHRVLRCEAGTLWLAIHLHPDAGAADTPAEDSIR
jgi:cupin 2 domain-containing protein